MSVLPVGFGSSSGGGGGSVDVGDIGHSVRLRRSASAYFSKTLAAPTNNKKWTWSGWVKRSEIGVAHGLFDRYVGSVDFSSLYISSDNRIYFYTVVTGPVDYSVETAVNSFRDTTGHVNVTFVFDSDNAVQADRAIIYISGVRQTVTNTYGAIPSGHTTYLNTAAAHSLGRLVDNSRYMDGYLSRVCFVDGQALDPTAFGYFNTTINEWVSKTQAQVKAVVDAGGTNSFMLDFDDPNFATYNVGKDFSSKNNHWTPTNISLTAGSTYDWCLDVPGNSYATLNPLMFRYSVGHATKSEANLKTTNPSGVASSYDWSTVAVASGKWYAEGVWTTTGTGGMSFGVDSGLAQYSTFTDYVTYLSNGTKNVGASNTSYGATYAVNDVIGIALDKDANTVTFYKNNVSQGAISLPNTAAPMFFHSGLPASGAAVFNFGQRPFTYTPPTGFKALCQANLPNPAILNPELHFDVRTRTGTAATYSVTDLLFQPDLAWIKSRGRAVDHALYDSVRGVQKQLESNQTGAETTETTGITAFNSNGYTGGALDQINGTTATNSFVDWLWKAGGAAVTNNNGSISSQVSANTVAGFSIVTFASLASGDSTVGHGLPKRPDLVIAKARNGSSFNWAVWHKNLANDIYRFLRLNTADPEQNPGSVIWGAGITDTVVGITNGQAVEASKDCVLYCHTGIEGYSKFTVVTMNGSADGQYIDLGFKAAIVDMKRIDAASNWLRWDKARSPDNPVNELLYPNLASSEATADLVIDITSQGVKVRGVVSGTWIVCAWADVPGKYALAR